MKQIIRTVAILFAVMVSPSYAEETADEANIEEAGPAESAKPAAQKLFYLLPICQRLEGSAEVLLPGETAWRAVQEGRVYPLGASYRILADESRMTLAFGPDTTVRLTGKGSFVTVFSVLGDKRREIILGSGQVDVSLPRTSPKGAFTVSSHGFAAKDLAGDSRYTRETSVDGDKVSVRCVTGVLSVEGRHFSVRPMRAAQEFTIRTSQDALATLIYGESGDLTLDLDQGAVWQKDGETGETKVVEKNLEWKLTPKTSVRILRAVPDIGERLAVTVMTFNVNGELVNRCAFTEKCPEVNSGELGERARSREGKKAGPARDGQTKAAQEDAAAAESSDAAETGEDKPGLDEESF